MASEAAPAARVSSGSVIDADLAVTYFIDHDHDAVRRFAADAIVGAAQPREQVRRLFVAVRDRIRYDPYQLPTTPDQYRASAIAQSTAGYCVPKAVLLVAAARHLNIPARLGFADVRNHLQSERLLTVMGTDLFRYHGYAVLHIDEHWRKASPAFNRELCDRFGVPPLEFDGQQDALLHPFTADGSRHMEYVEDHGHRHDLPLDEILAAYRASYPAIDAAGARDDILLAP